MFFLRPISDHALLFVKDLYESAFLMVAGDLKKPIPVQSIPAFLENLFPSFQYRISPYNVREILEVFGRNGVRQVILLNHDDSEKNTYIES